MNHHRTIEVCCGSAADVREARLGGASRVELCSALELGGLTPSAGLIALARKECGPMSLGVIIRPRGGDFTYTEAEIATMRADVAEAARLGADVIVIGALTAEGDIDAATCRQLMAEAPGREFTFHRAIDLCPRPLEALETIISLGFSRVLTSGGKPTAEEGLPLIAQMAEQAAGRISVMPGSGINPGNIGRIEAVSRASEFHSTARGEATVRPVCGNAPLGFGENRPQRATDRRVVARLVGGQ